MIELYQFAPAFGLPSASPLCTKVECYLRLADLNYKSRKVGLITAQRGHVPALLDKGQTIYGAEPGFDYLRNTYDDRLGKGLASPARAQQHALIRMIEEHLYFTMLYERWKSPDNAKIMGRAVLPWVPPPLRWMLVRKIRKLADVTLTHQGTGLHSPNQIAVFAQKDLAALALSLGKSVYFGGDRPREIDCVAYSFLSHILVPPLASKLRDKLLENAALSLYVSRFHQAFFDDFPVPFEH